VPRLTVAEVTALARAAGFDLRRASRTYLNALPRYTLYGWEGRYIGCGETLPRILEVLARARLGTVPGDES
jgi:hypothetical protein